MAKLEEITAVFLGERIRFGEVVVGVASICNGNGANEIDFLKPTTIKGPADIDELLPNFIYKFFGRWTTYKNKRTQVEERQFAFDTFHEEHPHGRDGVIAYLVESGRGRGIGNARASKMYELWGSSAIRILREEPATVLAAISGLSNEDVRSASEWLKDRLALEGCTVDVIDLLANRGFPKTTAKRAVKAWGNLASAVIRRDPYRLMAFRGCGFRRCDALWLDLGLSPSRLRRQAICAWYFVARDTDGHTWFPVEFAQQGIRQQIGGAGLRLDDAIELATRLGKIAPDRNGSLAVLHSDSNGRTITDSGRRWVAEGRKAWCENTLADLVVNAMNEQTERRIVIYDTTKIEEKHIPKYARCIRCHRKLTADTVAIFDSQPYGPDCIQKVDHENKHETTSLVNWLQKNAIVTTETVVLPKGYESISFLSLWPRVSDIEKISDHQREQLAKALQGPIAILGGSPGTGKTYVAAKLIKTLIKSIGSDQIAVAAPTGKAAVRITEIMQANGIPLRARTWHSLLGIGKVDKESGNWGFNHSEKNPLPFKVLVGDEWSMCDTNLACSVFRARSAGTHMLLVGDVNQLPPVGHGAPLRDLIAAGLPYGELREIHRNSGGIVEACAAIRDGHPWTAGDNLRVIEQGNPERQLAAMLSAINDAEREGYDPVWDCQVVVAVNAKSPLSRKAVNQLLQQELNANATVPGSQFRFKDKIVCLKNGTYKSVLYDSTDENIEVNEEGEVRVANGELAEVLEVREGLVIAKLTNPERVIQIPCGKASQKEQEDDENEEEKSSTGCQWDLGYAISVHKSQGSEWKVVIVMVDDYPGAKMVCDRAWLYTAISRAKGQCILIGRASTAQSFCGRNSMHRRKTFLRELIHLKTAERTLVGL